MSVRYSITRRVSQALRTRRGPGYIDHFDATRVAGWVADPNDPEAPALLSLQIDGTPAMNIVADLVRDDVQAAGLGPRRCGFDAILPRRLRDGQPHVVELRLGPDGPVLRGGRLRIPGDPTRTDAEYGNPEANTLDMPTGAPEGVAFYNPRTAAIEGWATGCASVSVGFPEQATLEVVLNRVIPGFGSGSRQGFAVKIPPELMDGAEHLVDVRFEAGGTALDGAPVRFATRSGSARATIVRRNGQRLILELRDLDGSPAPEEIAVFADGVALEVTSSKDAAHQCEVTLPEGLTHLVIQDAEDRPMGRFIAQGMRFLEHAAPQEPADVLDPARLAEARAAFDAFCAEPDDRFDPLWYRWAQPGTHALENADLIAHYRKAAPTGAAPGPFFDETAARRLTPGLDAAISAGDLPCAFALELVLGDGSLNSLAHLKPSQARALAKNGKARAALMMPPDDDAPTPQTPSLPSPLPVRMPVPTYVQSPADSIYAAWVSRLQLSPKQKQTIEEDERALRHGIMTTALTRAPLISIIMPSWNRAFTIGEAIQSVLDQTYSNWELIVSDDASEDRTVEVVRRFDDKRIRYMKFLKSNGAGARNKGLRFARGEYIAYLDSDNIWHPQFLDMMIRRLMASPGHSIAYAAYLDTEIDGAKVQLHEISRPSFRPIRLSSKNFMDLNTIMHHRRLYDWLGGFDNSLPRLQDWDLSLRYTAVFRPLFVNQIGVFYRRNAAWGQVTHLQMTSGAQNTVNEKNQARLEQGPERLNISWPTRARISLLCGPHREPAITQQHRALAESIAEMAADVADVDLILLGDTAKTAEMHEFPGVTRHAIPTALAADPLRLGRALGTLLQGRPVLSIGPRNDFLRALEGLDPMQTFRLRTAGERAVLQGLGLPTVQFDLGVLPLTLPDGAHAPEDMTLLVLPPTRSTTKLFTEIGAEARRRGLRLLVPPRGTEGWQFAAGGTLTPLEDERVLPQLLGQCAITACLGPVSELGLFEMALLNGLQGRGAPAAVLPDSGRARAEGFANQWIEAKAAYEIQVNAHKWIFDKLRKLMSDPGGMQQMSERSQIVHRIAFSQGLARERLVHALYRMQFDQPKREVINVSV